MVQSVKLIQNRIITVGLSLGYETPLTGPEPSYQLQTCDFSVHATLKRPSVLVQSLPTNFKASAAKKQLNFIFSVQLSLDEYS